MLLLEAIVHKLTPREEIGLLHIVILEIVRGTYIDLRLVVVVELGISPFAIITLGAIGTLCQATGASWVPMLPDHLLLTLSYLEQWVDIETWRVLHHE